MPNFSTKNSCKIRRLNFRNSRCLQPWANLPPQFILALTILFRKGSLEGWIFQLAKDPIALLQVVTSIGSTVIALTGLVTDLPVNGETPVRDFAYKFLKILPLMSLVALPRLFSLCSAFSLASIYNWQNLTFFTVLTLLILLTYGLSYFALYSCLKKKDKSLKSVGIKGFFTSIIAPCMIGSFYSPYFMSTSVLSALFHSIFAGVTWITSMHFPQIFLTTIPDGQNELPESLRDKLSVFHQYCLVLIPFLIGSIFFSYLIYLLYKNKNKTAKLKAHISNGNVEAITRSITKLKARWSQDQLSKVMKNDMFTPLAYAAEFSGPSGGEEPGVALKLFIGNHEEWKVDFNARNRDGQTPLMRTAILNGIDQSV